MNAPIRLPDFYIIGAAKCATTDLASLLDNHPAIYMSRPKEPGFFCRDELANDVGLLLDHTDAFWRALDWDENFGAIVRDYGRLFAEAPAGARAGEASTWYFLSKRAPGRIRELTPGARLIAILREPTSRLISDYWFKVQGGRTCVDPVDYFYTKQAADGVRWGLYAEHLGRWLSVFPRDRLHVILFEEYTNPRTRQAVVDGVCRFLGVAPTLDAARVATSPNRTAAPRWVRLELALNMARLRFKLPGSSPPDHETRRPWGRKRRLIHAIVRAISRGNLSSERRPPAWPTELIERLRAYYSHENAGLSDLIGRDVEAIWYGRKARPWASAVPALVEPMEFPVPAPALSVG